MHTVSNQFLLWSEFSALWSLSAYGTVADPLPGDKERFQSRMWRTTLICRCLLLAIVAFLMSHSLILALWAALFLAAVPTTRYKLPDTKIAEWEVVSLAMNLTLGLVIIKKLGLSLWWTPLRLPMAQEHIAALAITTAMFFFMVRGGTYFVRGWLNKAGTLPRIAYGDEATGGDLDNLEINRGRLIGNLERVLLALVVLAGSYAALGFLVAAKGLVRSEDLENRNFAEYFLVGSFASVLIALCVGMTLRLVFVWFWPELISLDIKS